MVLALGSRTARLLGVEAGQQGSWGLEAGQQGSWGAGGGAARFLGLEVGQKGSWAWGILIIFYSALYIAHVILDNDYHI